MTVEYQSVPAIGGADYRKANVLTLTDAKIVKSAHVGSDMRAEGVNYNEVEGMDVTTQAYPAGTVMKDNTPSDDVN